jgi:hypothetical protein
VDKCVLFNSYEKALEKYEEFDSNQNFPDDIYSVLYHRRFVKRDKALFAEFRPQIVATPMVVLMPLKPSGRRIYEEVWALGSKILKDTSVYHDRRNRWWEAPNW